MFFIQKYKDGTIVKFTKVPQVSHKKFDTIRGVTTYPYLRTITGRICKIEDSYQETIDTAKDLSYTKLQTVWKFNCRFLDNNEIIILEPNNYMCSVRILLINLLLYKIFMFFNKNKKSNSNEQPT